MQVVFWFDPVCPFCWMTSRWITAVAPHRDLEIEWRPISLLMKNELAEDHPFHPRVSRTLRMLRVVEALRAAGRADLVGPLYTALGTRVHHEDDIELEIAEVLEHCGCDPTFAAAADDPAWDEGIRVSMDEALELTGQDVGTPIISIPTPGGRVAFFGPVITRMPDPDQALALWDGFVAMASTPAFFELKRTRSEFPDHTTIPR